MVPKESRYVTLPSTGHAITDSLQIARHAFTEPNTTTVLVPPAVLGPTKDRPSRKPAERAKSKPPETAPGTIVANPTYNWLLLGVGIFTIGCLIALIALSSIWTEPATHFQDKTFEAIDWGFKIGVGFFIGLLGGKTT
jgi:hypothetical protein